MDRALLKLEDLFARLGLVHHVGSEDIAGHEVGGELDPRELQVQDVGDGGDDLRLADPGDPFQQDMPLGQQADQHTVDDLLGTDDDLADFLADERELLGEAAYSLFDFGCHRFSRGRMARKYLLTRFR